MEAPDEDAAEESELEEGGELGSEDEDMDSDEERRSVCVLRDTKLQGSAVMLHFHIFLAVL